MLRSVQRMLAPTAGVGLLGWYVHSEHQEFLAMQDDAACEETLPPTGEAQHTRVVRLPRLFSAEEIQSIHELHESVASKVGTSGRTASNQAASYHSGVWEVSYLSTDGHFRARRPELLDKLINAAYSVDAEQQWGLLRDREHVRPRCIEYHGGWWSRSNQTVDPSE